MERVLWQVFQHQFLPLLPPLALLGGGLALAWPAPVFGRQRMDGADVGRRGALHAPGVRTRARATRPDQRDNLSVVQGVAGRIVLPIAAIALVIYAVILVRSTLTLDGHLFKTAAAPNRAALIALIDRTTRPGDYVVCDDPNVALGARRPVPPGLEDPSRVRAAAGYLTVARLEAATVRYHVAAIVASRPRFARYLPAYLTWAAAHYRAVPSPASGAQVFLRR